MPYFLQKRKSLAISLKKILIFWSLWANHQNVENQLTKTWPQLTKTMMISVPLSKKEIEKEPKNEKKQLNG